MNHSLYVFAFILFSVFLFFSLVIHTDFKFVLMDYFERLLEKFDLELEELEEEERKLLKEKEDLEKLLEEELKK